MDTPELFPGEHEVRETATQAGWSASVGNGWAAVFESPEDAALSLRAYASFFDAGVRPAFLIVETLDGDPMRAPLGLQVWVGTKDGRVPTPGEARALLGEHGPLLERQPGYRTAVGSLLQPRRTPPLISERSGVHGKQNLR